MAERHVRAVQIYSKIEDALTRNIVEIIALDIGEDDSPAYTSLRKIAQRARCAVNTAQERINDAIATGELIQNKGGKFMLYGLNPELLPYGSTSERVNSGKHGKGLRPITADDLERFKEGLYQELYQNNEELYQRLYQQIVSIVSTHQRGDDTEDKGKSIKKDSDPPAVELAKHFQAETGCLPNLEAYRADWEPVLEDWINQHGLEGSKRRITAGAAFAKGGNEQKRRYTITSPRSLANIIANLPPESLGGTNGVVSVRTR